MAKFDRKAQQLKARVQFIRGSVRKTKGQLLSDSEADTMTDDAVQDEIDLGNLEAVDREPEGAPNSGGDAGAGDAAGDKAGGKKPGGK